ncbi:MAG: glycosyltransferase [Lewinellaceae bacterium]|nr:glycosyltransferase [Lewinellaceae bacterium]
MPVWIVFSLLLTIVYAGIMLRYLRGWRALPEWRISPAWEAQKKVTILIPARNEAECISDCLQSILAGSYPLQLLEIMVIDDFSEDETVSIVASIVQAQQDTSADIRLLRLSEILPPDAAGQANKKSAIEAGIARASGELIVTTDADCIVGKDWLRLLISRFDAPLETALQPLLVTGPVLFHREQNVLQYFQSLDFLGLMGITGAGIHQGFQRMGNGAHLAYYRSVFQAVDGYAGNRQTASGDDMFLIQKVAARFPGRIAFLKNPDAAVRTEAKPDWRSFVQQRLRWGAKNAGLPEWPVRLILLSVFLFCGSIWFNLIAFLTFRGTFELGQIIVIQIIVKAVFDWMLLSEMCRFFKRTDLLRWFLPSFFLHTLYIPLIGTASLFFKKYAWKGREVRV